MEIAVFQKTVIGSTFDYGIEAKYELQTLTTKDCKGRAAQTNMPENIGAMKT